MYYTRHTEFFINVHLQLQLSLSPFQPNWLLYMCVYVPILFVYSSLQLFFNDSIIFGNCFLARYTAEAASSNDGGKRLLGMIVYSITL